MFTHGLTATCVQDIHGVSTATHDKHTPIDVMNSLPMIIISRFILHLRRSDQNARTVASRPSRFNPSGLHITVSAGGFIGDLGQPLDHGFDVQEQPDEDHIHDGPHLQPEAGPSRTRTDVEEPTSESHIERYVLHQSIALPVTEHIGIRSIGQLT